MTKEERDLLIRLMGIYTTNPYKFDDDKYEKLIPLKDAVDIVDLVYKVKSKGKEEMTIEKCRSHLLDIMDSMPDDSCGDWRDALAYAVEIIDKHNAENENKKTTREEAIREIESYMPKDEPMNTKDREAFFMAIKALKQESVLDKIKAEIEALPKTYPFVNHIDMYVKEDDVRKIIDRHKAQISEGKE